jgi:hypothetical protein
MEDCVIQVGEAIECQYGKDVEKLPFEVHEDHGFVNLSLDQLVLLKDTHPYELPIFIEKIKDCRDFFGYTPLHYFACTNNDLDVLKQILRMEKIDINTQDLFGFTPVFWAIKFKSESAGLFKDFDADLELKTIFGTNQTAPVALMPSNLPISPPSPQKKRIIRPKAYINSLTIELLDVKQHFSEKHNKLFLVEFILKYTSTVWLFPRRGINTNMWQIELLDPITGIIIKSLGVDAVMQCDQECIRLVVYHFPRVKCNLRVKFLERNYTSILGLWKFNS